MNKTLLAVALVIATTGCAEKLAEMRRDAQDNYDWMHNTGAYSGFAPNNTHTSSESLEADLQEHNARVAKEKREQFEHRLLVEQQTKQERVEAGHARWIEEQNEKVAHQPTAKECKAKGMVLSNTVATYINYPETFHYNICDSKWTPPTTCWKYLNGPGSTGRMARGYDVRLHAWACN